MERPINRYTVQIKDLILLLCLFMICATGHAGFYNEYPWVNTLLTVSRYAMYGLLLLDTVKNKAVLTSGFVWFLACTVLAAALDTIYNVFAAQPHFDMVASLRQVLFYLLFVYTGYYIAYTNGGSGKLFRWLRNVAVCAAVVIVIQFVLRYAGIYLNRLPAVGDFFFHAVDTQIYFRPSAFFSEPSYAAEVLILDLYANLFLRRNLRLAALEIVALLISTSALGIVFGSGLVAWWVLTQRLTRYKAVDLVIKTAAVAAFLGILVFLFGYSGDNQTILRLLEGATIRQRTLRAFELYGKLQPLEQIFGIGMQNLARYLQTYGVTLVNEGVDTLVNPEFAQSFGYVLCTLGLLGAVGFCSLFVGAVFRIPPKKRILAAVLFGMSLTCSLISRQIFCLMIAMMFSVANASDADVQLQEEVQQS